MTAAAFAVFASAGVGAGFFAAVVVCAGLAGAAADFAFAGSAGAAAPWSSVFDPNRLLKKPPELPAEATCTDERGAMFRVSTELAALLEVDHGNY